MKITELRVGNYVSLRGLGDEMKVCVLSIEEDRIFYNTKLEIIPKVDFLYSLLLYVHPIPLTEDWFIKLGFKADSWGDGDKIRRWEKGSLELATPDDIAFPYGLAEEEENADKWFLTEGGEYQTSDIPIEYVHQLQNLYFARTGKELENEE